MGAKQEKRNDHEVAIARDELYLGNADSVAYGEFPFPMRPPESSIQGPPARRGEGKRILEEEEN